jgi:hypothetical protein
VYFLCPEGSYESSFYYEKEGFLLEKRVAELEKDMSDMKTRMAVAESSIKDVKEDISSIKDDTKWLRRSITNAFVVALVGGAVAIFYAVIQKGGM